MKKIILEFFFFYFPEKYSRRVCSGSTLFASIFNLSVMLGNYLQQTTSADDNFRCIFFLGALRIKNRRLCPQFLTSLLGSCKQYCIEKQCLIVIIA